MKSLNKILNLGLASTLCAFSSLAVAAEGGGTVGVQVGWGIPMSTTGIGGGLDFGLGGEFMVSPEFGVGALLGYQMFSVDGSPAGASASAMPILVTGNFHLAGAPVYVGANLGFVRNAATVEILGVSATTSTFDFSFGGQVGYDFEVSAATKVGLEARYVMCMTDGDSYGIFNTNAQVKFVF